MRCVIFDWDGTLADTQHALFAANAAVMQAMGLPFDEATYRRHYTPDWRSMYERLGVPRDRIEEANAIWHEAYRNGATAVLLAGALDAVRRIEAAGIVTALVTAGSRGTVEPQIERAGLDGHLAVRVYGDDQPEQKPDPAPLRRALRELGWTDRSSAAYLGDAPDDMRMAVTTGVHAFGVVSFFSDAAGLRAAGAEDVVTSVAEWVERLLGPAAPETVGAVS